MKVLLANGADPNLTNDRAFRGNQMTVLRFTMTMRAWLPRKTGSWPEKGWREGVEILLNRGADPNIKNEDDDTVLHLAMRSLPRQREKFLELLLKHGADLYILNKKGESPLDIAARCTKGCDEMKETLAKYTVHPSVNIVFAAVRAR